MGHTGKRRAKKEKKQKLIHGHKLISDNWDSELTLSQNYAKLGLLVSTTKTSGGTVEEAPINGLPISVKTRTAQIVHLPDGSTKIVEQEQESALDEPIKAVQPKTEIAQQLEEIANQKDDRPKKDVSEDQRRYCQQLVSKHGDNYEKMQWDKRLNPFQYSAGELKRQIKRCGIEC